MAIGRRSQVYRMRTYNVENFTFSVHMT